MAFVKSNHLKTGQIFLRKNVLPTKHVSPVIVYEYPCKMLFSDPLRAKANSPNQMETINRYHNITGGAPSMGDYTNPSNVVFPFLEEVQSMVHYNNCINADFKLIVDKGRR